jgi:alpha-N-acetylglucosaminidase
LSPNEYACKQWSGLLTDFYKPRWEQFFLKIEDELKNGKNLDVGKFSQEIREWEWNWVNRRKDYPVQPVGDPVMVAREFYSKYRSDIGDR